MSKLLIIAIMMLENPEKIQGVHRDGVSHGLIGVTQDCLDDIHKHYPARFTLKSADDPRECQSIFVLYTDLYAGVRATDEERAKVWHCGPSWKESPKRVEEAREYWDSVKNLMDDMKKNGVPNEWQF